MAQIRHNFVHETKKLNIMIGYDNKITCLQDRDGWTRVKIFSYGNVINGRVLVEKRVTLQLDTPMSKCAKIETVDRVYDDDAVATYAEKLIDFYNCRAEQLQREWLSEHREELLRTIIPLWFEREAYRAIDKANARDIRNEARRQYHRGEMGEGEFRSYIRLAQRDDDEDYADGMHRYNDALHKQFTSLNMMDKFSVNMNEACELYGDCVWEDMLRVRHIQGDERREFVHRIYRHMLYFNDLYNLESKESNREDLLDRYDTFVVVGFGELILAAALMCDGQVEAVWARDHAQGRRALRHLVGKETLARVLPKRVYNAVTRTESCLFSELTYEKYRNYLFVEDGI